MCALKLVFLLAIGTRVAAGGLFDAFGKVMGLGDDDDPTKPKPTLPFIPTVNNNGANNNPNFNNDFFGNGGGNFNNPNYNPNGNNNYDNNGNNGNNFKFIDPSRDFMTDDVTTSRSIFGDDNLELTKEEEIAAQKFPELQKLLEKLKELNKRKEADKAKEESTKRTSTTEASNKNKGAVAETGGDSEEKPASSHNYNGWKRLKKRKIFYQAQPVRPENEISSKKKQVVFYMDKKK